MPLRNPLAGVSRKPAVRKGAALGAAAIATLALAGRTDRAATRPTAVSATPNERQANRDLGRPSVSGAPSAIGKGGVADSLSNSKVHQGTLSLEVTKGTFDGKFARVGALAARHHAEITSSSSQSSSKDHSGSIDMRVPVSQLAALTAELHGLGNVTSTSTDSVDNARFVQQLDQQIADLARQADDLRARIAKTTDAAQLSELRSELGDVQLQLDSANAQKVDALDSEARATLSVDMQEDVTVATPTQLATDWHHATTAALSVLGAVVIGLGYGIPTLVLFAAAWGAMRLARRRPVEVAPVVG